MTNELIFTWVGTAGGKPNLRSAENRPDFNPNSESAYDDSTADSGLKANPSSNNKQHMDCEKCGLVRRS